MAVITITRTSNGLTSGRESVIAMGWIGHGDMTTASPGKPAFVEHARAALDQPGEWFLDRESGRLTCVAPVGKSPGQVVAVAPVLKQLVKIAGSRE